MSVREDLIIECTDGEVIGITRGAGDISKFGGMILGKVLGKSLGVEVVTGIGSTGVFSGGNGGGNMRTPEWGRQL